MAKKPDDTDEGAWGFRGDHGADPDHYREMVRNTKLRTLADMSENEICALEQQYGCAIMRPTRPRRARATA